MENIALIKRTVKNVTNSKTNKPVTITTYSMVLNDIYTEIKDYDNLLQMAPFTRTGFVAIDKTKSKFVKAKPKTFLSRSGDEVTVACLKLKAVTVVENNENTVEAFLESLEEEVKI